MKHHIKKIVLFSILVFATVFSSCEKELYEEALQEQKPAQGKLNYLKINDLPFLKPTIQKFKNKHQLLNHNKAIDSLDLDLQRIIEYTGQNGFKSYSIAIKQAIFENDDYYFENLHILKDGDKYDFFIVKYNPLDDSKKFDYGIFTGKLEIFNDDKIYLGNIQFENGLLKYIDPAPPTPPNELEGSSGGGGTENPSNDCPCDNSPSLLGQFFGWIGSLFSNIDISMASGDPSNTGYVLVVTPENIGTSSNNTNPNQTSGSSSGGVVIAPNEPQWTYPVTSQIIMANRIESRIVNSGDNIHDWLHDNNNHDSVDAIYFFMAEGGNETEVNVFATNTIIALMNGGEIDFGNKIILDPSFVNSISECIHNKLKTNPNNIYSKLLSNFNANTNKTLTFKIGNTLNGDWGITKGDLNSVNSYTITTSFFVENGSNLMKIITLSHELIHAYMFSVLESNGHLTFVNGEPNLNINCNNNTNYNIININTLPINDRFTALICGMNQNGTLTPDWTHDLFNSAVFDINIYRQAIEDLILTEYDWNSENLAFKNEAISVFGNTWKEEISKIASWLGLEGTVEYTNYFSTYSSYPLKQLYIVNARTKIYNSNSNCP